MPNRRLQSLEKAGRLSAFISSKSLKKTCWLPVKTRWGTFRFLVSQRGLRRLRFPLRRNHTPRESAQLSCSELRRARSELLRYLEGKSIRRGRLALDDGKWSNSKRMVLETIARIAPGEVRSYRWVAEQSGLGRGFRAVGQILKSNPLPIFFPCHRVVRQDGSLGGYQSGIRWKKRLLLHERKVVFKKRKRDS